MYRSLILSNMESPTHCIIHRMTGISYLFLVPVFIFISLGSRSQVLDPVYIDNNLYDYIFGIGSTWTYEEATTGTVDSLAETDNQHDFNAEVWVHGTPVLGPVEYYKSYYESMTLDYQTWDQFIGYVIVREGYDWGNGGQYIFLASYEAGDKSGNTEIVAIFDTLQISNFTFTTVTKMLVMQNQFEDFKPTCYYFAKNVGLVRKEILSDDTTRVIEQWNLRNYYLVNSLAGFENHQEYKDFEFYPNPAYKQATLKVLNPGLLPLEMKVYDAEGRNVLRKTIDQQSTIIDMSGMPGGIYFAHLSNKNFNKYLKIIRK